MRAYKTGWELSVYELQSSAIDNLPALKRELFGLLIP